ncbi:hypothetical protein K504DRAFT_508046 [Pleomassaria siparia CBS 279.74]|uniref:Uncharacterized protein n=1 Tax=Pleomassaria siparia CBS 279.74 TaxID=1314801 RepID=A0A6G1JTI2_9PLEO|nr:hypothetical protein K504DRAFT_508046 [Pleomassaria siparia CBS 279.74]
MAFAASPSPHKLYHIASLVRPVSLSQLGLVISSPKSLGARIERIIYSTIQALEQDCEHCHATIRYIPRISIGYEHPRVGSYLR